MAGTAITLTPSDGSAAFIIQTNSIANVYSAPDGSGDAIVQYSIGGSDLYRIQVTETPATIGGLCDNLILVTTANGNQYIYIGQANDEGICEVVTDGTGCKIYWKWNESATQTIIFSTDSKATIASRIVTAQAYVPTGNTYTNTTGITAHAGGGQGSATAITTEYNNVTVCATAGDSVVLPAAAAGLRAIIKNNGATACAVFPATGDTINGGAANASITLVPGDQIIFSAINTTDWETDSSSDASGTTYTNTITELTSGSGITFSNITNEKTTNAITAHAGGGQGSATALVSELNVISVCATAADSVVLPTAKVGMAITVKNNGATDAAVFPATGATIDGGAADASVTLPIGCTRTFYCNALLTWNADADRASTASGTVGAPSHTFDAQPTNGMYSISSTQTGFATGGVLKGGVDSSGLFTGVVSEQTATAGVLVDGALLKDGSLITRPTAAAINVTGNATAAQMLGGAITSTSAAAVAITTPTATAIMALISGGGIGTQFDLAIDNSQGANTVTLTLDASITAPVGAVTGGNTLTITTTHKVGIFRFYFTGATTAVVYRIA